MGKAVEVLITDIYVTNDNRIIMMEQIELDNLNREELFAELKDQCKSRTKATFYAMLTVSVIAIVFMIIFGRRLSETKDMIGFISWTLIGCIAVGSILYNCRFKKGIDQTNDPGQLLQSFKKTIRIEWLSVCAEWLLLIAYCFVNNSIYSGIGALISFVVIMIMAYNGYGRWHHRDKEIIEQLHELAEEK